ncbi:hypothetical protein [Granulicella sp. dw_53]|uniref:hypothetical protein n=1 Tax=Granulicella sp. dw_53 TaxID=2719792 RepID=UPI001BD24B23|nr:hypothetical protein [Granulicella sp. dw_53]
MQVDKFKFADQGISDLSINAIHSVIAIIVLMGKQDGGALIPCLLCETVTGK